MANVEDHRVNCPDGMDGGDLDDGVGDMGFDLNNYQGAEELFLIALHHCFPAPTPWEGGPHTVGAMMLHL